MKMSSRGLIRTRRWASLTTTLWSADSSNSEGGSLH
jgi:hypothetical protein